MRRRSMNWRLFISAYVLFVPFCGLICSQKRRQSMSERSVTFYRWDEMPKEKVSEEFDRRLITADRMMLAHVYLKKGAIVPRHSHENEQITYILEGGLRF